MIESIIAQNGNTILRQNGRLLASRVDPMAEAEAWIQHRLAFLDKVKGVFVLGLGCGYHIQSLLKHTNARVVVIEQFPEIIELVQTHFDWAQESRLKIQQHSKASQLRGSSAVKEIIRDSFVVLTHPASYSQAATFYQECRAQLTGREWGALTWQWRLKDLPSLDSAPRLTSSAEPLTIYDLEQTELVQNSNERERLLLKALRELVK